MSSELQRLDLKPGPYEFTVCGLAMTGESTPQQWEECGQALRQVEEAKHETDLLTTSGQKRVQNGADRCHLLQHSKHRNTLGKRWWSSVFAAVV